MKVSDAGLCVFMTTMVIAMAVAVYGKHVGQERMTAAVQECIRTGGVPLTTERHTYCMARGAMIGFPDVHPNQR